MRFVLGKRKKYSGVCGTVEICRLRLCDSSTSIEKVHLYVQCDYSVWLNSYLFSNSIGPQNRFYIPNFITVSLIFISFSFILIYFISLSFWIVQTVSGGYTFMKNTRSALCLCLSISVALNALFYCHIQSKLQFSFNSLKILNPIPS